MRRNPLRIIETPILGRGNIEVNRGLMKITESRTFHNDNIELLLIDMDGTLGFSLIPEEKAISSAIKWVSEEVSRVTGQPTSEDEVKQIYKDIKSKQYKLYPLQTLRHDKTLRFTMLLEELSRSKQIKMPAKTIDKIMRVYWRVFGENATPYPTTHSTLEELRHNHKVVVITNNGKYEGEKKRKIFGLKPKKHYDLFITSEELGGTCKPSEQYLNRVLDLVESSLGMTVDRGRIVIVGDDPSGDIALANMCQVPSVRVRKDLHSTEEPKSDLERASAEINEINELLNLL